MDYAMKSFSVLTTSSLSKCVTASASMTQQLLTGRASRPRPFRVTNADRSLKKGIMAYSLADLINKVGESLSVLCVSGLVLDEDGTGVDTEGFFQALPENSVLMVLEKDQKWTPDTKSPSRGQPSDFRLWKRTDVARLTFDLYKNNPEDFIGCLNVKATFYGVYSVSYDLRCYAAKKMLKEALRWAVFSMQAAGHILLGSSCYIEYLLQEEQAAKTLSLPQESRIRQLQSMLLGRASQL
ncbi:cell death activator CIDE-3 [Takifugu rubripes]|uniref:cell death activator CIDE-3 n=1 Tax=Takifugu rubripes TaxID=31033 RepID=UPI000298E316|nr:cell death activator CIDE-3-like [Takifugu rubripes]XP_029683051.1 cell death activator CIDE-3-like [Takifugu rubripes]|eukprot:XP_003973632.1 PREDICTED: cell death activator CIDE-3-like [Takifugu rubripes]